MHIVISETMHEAALGLLRERASLHYDAGLFNKRDELAGLLAHADALIVRNKTQVNAELLEHAGKLRVLGRLGVGLDNLELEVLRARGITVNSAVGENAVSVAEYVIGAMLELSRRFSRASAKLHEGQWDRQSAIGAELFGKTLGIIGLGDIGTRLSKRADAFGMRILANDPVINKSSFAVQEYRAELADLATLLQESDFVSLHAPLLKSTYHLINAKTLALMKLSAYLINTSRGALVDEAALAGALKEERLAGAALDVREQEPPAADDPLRGMDQVLLTPHAAGVTLESNYRVSMRVAKDVLRALE